MKKKSLVLLATIGAFCAANFHATVHAQSENAATVQKAAGWNNAWVDEMLNYNENENRTVFVIEGAFRNESPSNYGVWEENLIALWNNPKLSVQARHRLPILLATVISDKKLGEIAPSLIDPERTHDAARVFSVVSSPDANKLLLDAYKKTDNSDCRICIIQSLGLRAAPELLEVTKNYSSLTKETEQIAVIRAAANYPTERSTEFLLRLIKESKGNLRDEAWLAFVKATDSYHKTTKEKLTVEEVGQVLAMAQDWREVSSVGFLVSKYGKDKNEAVKFLQKYFGDSNQYLAVNMASYLREIGGGSHLDSVVKSFDSYSTEVRGALLRVFEDAKYQPAVACVNKSILSDDEWLAQEAIFVAQNLYDKDTAVCLIKVLKGNDNIVNAASRTLSISSMSGVEPELSKLATGSDSDLSKRAFDILGSRRSAESRDVLFKLSENSKYKANAIRSLEKLADAQMLAMIVPKIKGANAADSKALMRIVALCAEAMEDDNGARAKILTENTPSDNKAAVVAMLGLLPRYESNEAYGAIEKSLNDSDDSISKEAFRALSACKNEGAIPVFEKALAMKADDSSIVMNFESYVRVLLDKRRTPKMNLSVAYNAVEQLGNAELKNRLVNFLGENTFWGTTVLLNGLSTSSSDATVKKAATAILENARSLQAPDVKGDGFVSLFDGKGLDGWKKVQSSAAFEVRDGSIVGICDPDAKKNTFLMAEKKYENFIFACDFKMVVPGNSGIQFRSEFKDDKMRGYQSEICDNVNRKWTGGVYDEGSDWLYPLTADRDESNWLKDKLFEKPRNAMKINDWNQVIIQTRGNRVQTWINGVLCADMLDNRYSDGVIALQIHAGKQGEIHWKNIRIKPLSKDQAGVVQ